MTNKHKNGVNPCPKCLELFNKYPNFNQLLQTWFLRKQAELGTCHISEAGRGYAAQEAAFKSKASRAHYGASAHNYNAALDVFFIDSNGKLSYDKSNYVALVLDLPNVINWYGKKGSAFYELPHFELNGWKSMKLKLVEPEEL